MLTTTPTSCHFVTRVAESTDLMVLTDIYRDDINLNLGTDSRLGGLI